MDKRLECLRLAAEMAESYDEAIRTAARMYALVTDAAKVFEPRISPITEEGAAVAALPVLEARINVTSLSEKIVAARAAKVNEAAFGGGEKGDTFSNAGC